MESNLFKSRIVKFDYAAVDQLLANELNWRKHPKDQQAAMEVALSTVGWTDAILINMRTSELWPPHQRAETMVDGHMRVLVCSRNGQDLVPALLVDLTPEEEAFVLATHDPIGAMAKADKEAFEKLRELAPQTPETVSLMQMIAAQQHIEETVAADAAVEKEVSLEKVDGSLHGVSSLKDWVIFESTQKFGVPGLLPDLLLDIPDDLNTWAGAASADAGSWLYIWGDSVKGLDLSRTVVGFYTDDWRYERFWEQPSEYAGKLVNAQVGGVIMPSFSAPPTYPEALRIWQRYRALWCARYWQEAGLRVLPEAQYSADDMGWLGIPEKVDISINCYNRPKGRNEDAGFGRFVQRLVAALNPPHILVYTDDAHWRDLQMGDYAGRLVWARSRASVRKDFMRS